MVACVSNESGRNEIYVQPATGAHGLVGFDVSPDGRRFVMALRENTDQTREGLEVVVNFFTEVQRLQSAGGHQ